MKKLAFIAAGLGILIFPVLTFAGVQGSDHDMTDAPDNADHLCQSCHIPHNAQGDKLWYESPGGTFGNMADLCYTCHDGTPTDIGLTTVFDITKEQHKLVNSDCSGTGMCHTVHNQNPNVDGRFLVVTETNNSYCETCHNDVQFPGAEGLGDHTAGLTHYTNGTTFTCNQCHVVHGATNQGTDPGLLTNPILIEDNYAGDFYGDFCISCHQGIPPPVPMPGAGGVPSGDPFDYSESVSDGSEFKHPTTSTDGADSWDVPGCNVCHEVHDPTEVAPANYILIDNNADSQGCVGCHDGNTAPDVGANTHYILATHDPNMNNGLTPALPWAGEIDEDGVGGADWLGEFTAGMMVCETCHSVHREGNQGLEADYLLRWENGTLNQLCSACHTTN